MRFYLPPVGVFCLFTFLIVLPVHAQTTVRLPVSAHAVGQFAGYYVDPSTGFYVYRLSDAVLCPASAQHFYAYSNQFSALGRIVISCQQTGGPYTFPVYDSNFKLLFTDAVAAAGGPSPGADIQWSQKREVLFGRTGMKVYEYDPFNHTYRIFGDFSVIQSVTRPDGTKVGVGSMRDLSVGPGDRLMVHLECRITQLNCPSDYKVVGVGTYDPATGKYSAIAVPHANAVAPLGFGKAHWTQNPNGRVTFIYPSAPNYVFSSDLASNVKYDDDHGHPGYFLGSNGESFKVNVRNITFPDGSVGQIGCSGVTPWTPQYALYDDVTGKRMLIWGCTMADGTPLGRARAHFSRVLGQTSRDAFFGSEYWIGRFSVQYNGTTPTGVTGKLVASSRSDPSPCNNDYWAQPRATADFTGNRVLWDTNWRWTVTPTVESNGSAITGCRKDVVVAVYGLSATADVSPPAVSINSAVPQTVRTLNIGFSATDNIGVARVDCYLDGIFLGSVDPSVTQSTTFDVSTFIAGTHTLQLKAFDAAGNSSSSSQYVNLP